MQLRGQAGPENAPGRDDLGYAMAVLLIGLSVMAILMTIAMPVWKHDAQREKEAELVFRGEQMGRALSLFQRKHGPGTTPTTVDALIQDHVLRKKYKDPITNDDFDVVLQGQNTAGSTTGLTSGRGGTTSTAPQGSSTAQRGAGGGSPSSGPVGGIFGFASKSKAESIRIYKGRSHYNEWLFSAPQFAQAPGGAPGGIPPGRGQGPGRGGPGQGPGGIPGTGGRGITILPNGQVIDPRTGQPLIDPRTGQPVTVPPGARGGAPPGGRGRGN
jgi:type II secretory pathway pseudopilin PulG